MTVRNVEDYEACDHHTIMNTIRVDAELAICIYVV